MISNLAVFWSYLLFLIPSLICSLFLLYYLLFDRRLRSALHNHVIIVVLFIVLIYELTIYPWMLHYYHHQQSLLAASNLFCTIRRFLDWDLYITQSFLVSWATIERHILIFHEKWILTKKKRFFLHYFPLISIVFYCLIFHTIVFFLPPCQNSFDHVSLTCVYSCLYEIYPEFSVWQTIFHQILPVVIIIVFSIALIIRVIWQKFRLHQAVHWRKYRKMTIQLLSIAFLYLLFYLPLSISYTILLCDVVEDIIIDFLEYSIFFSYFMILLFPFVSILSLPELQMKLLNRLRRKISPINVPVYK